MSEFSKSDFSECCQRIDLPYPIKKVVKAWGVSGREYADWTGGFVVEFNTNQKFAKYGYISGWSDSSGWG
jgi:hypothetical protein